jgi:predicted GIY-YIG superfamily endonuclease
MEKRFKKIVTNPETGRKNTIRYGQAVPGVYKITCKSNGHYYYGSSVNMEARFRNHLSKLHTKKHRNHRLQRLFEKYGEDSLIFETVEVCERNMTTEVEQKYLDVHVSDPLCINFSRDATAPMRGLKFSETHARRISEAQSVNKYIFTFECGKVEEYTSLRHAAKRFNVRPASVSEWFKRPNLGRKHGTMVGLGIIKAEKIGAEPVTLLPFPYREQPWVLAGATSRGEYYRQKRRDAAKSPTT